MLKIRYISIDRLNSLRTNSKIDLIIEHIKENNIILVDGRLKSRDEAELIRRTMIDLHKEFQIFHGVEMVSLQDGFQTKKGVMGIFRKEPKGITIIGPASIITEMKQQTDHVELNIKKDRR